MPVVREITEWEFNLFRDFIYSETGIVLSERKKTLVVSRLSRHLYASSITSFGEYFNFIQKSENHQQKQAVIDSLTTNETYFFREPEHFELLQKIIRSNQSDSFNIWSAASSSGEEVFTLAMVLAETTRRKHWQVYGSDISETMLQRGSTGIYPMDRARNMPVELLKKYCLKGIGEDANKLMIGKKLRSRIHFFKHNLLASACMKEKFDVIFLRNVLIYFDNQTKAEVIARLLEHLHPQGYLFIGLSDRFPRQNMPLKVVAPSVFQLV